jgi:hypothetical protein
VAPLQRETADLPTEQWVAHFNSGYFDGEWSGVALRSAGGAAGHLFSDPNAPQGNVADSEVLERCPKLREVLGTFQCPIRSARLLRLTAGSSIREHKDYQLGYDEGEIRLHIPIFTNADVAFFLDGRRVVMNEGECWYLDFNLPHHVENHSAVDRIHLVLDCAVNDWLLDLFPAEAFAPDVSNPAAIEQSAFSSGELERFRHAVLRDPGLQRRLRTTSDRGAFVRLVMEMGIEQDFHFAPEDVQEAMLKARRAWSDTWIQ